MMYNLAVFQEPRGVMRIIQFIFSICAFATTTSFTALLSVNCAKADTPNQYEISYPFILKLKLCGAEGFNLVGNYSSDAQFFVATGVLSFLYCIFAVILYVCFDEIYKSKHQIPLTDFILTVILAVFWLSGSAAWANGLSGLRSVTELESVQHGCTKEICTDAAISSFNGLIISVILGFLNFFLWASDLWFLYKETPWFQLKTAAASGPITPTI